MIPEVEMQMGLGLPPTGAALAARANLNIGTDVVTGVSTDMFTQMRFLIKGPFSRAVTAFVDILGKELKEAMAPPTGRRGQAKIANWLKSGVSHGKIRPSADRQSRT